MLRATRLEPPSHLQPRQRTGTEKPDGTFGNERELQLIYCTDYPKTVDEAGVAAVRGPVGWSYFWHKMQLSTSGQNQLQWVLYRTCQR